MWGISKASSNHEARIDRLEEDRKVHGKKIDETHTTVTTLAERTKNTDDNVTSILKLLNEKGPG